MMFKKCILILFLLIVLAYVTNITAIPNNIVIFDGETVELGTIFGLNKRYEQIVTTSLNNGANNIVNEEKIKLSLFGLLDLKDVNITTVEKTSVIPLGNIVGLKLYASGVLVIGTTEIEGQKPYENAGIKEGDLITHIDKIQVNTTEELIECVNSSKGKMLELTYIRNGEEYVTSIEPAKISGKDYKLGLWVKDGAAGIGTATYYEPKTKGFAALGHGIIDSDTEKLIPIDKGELVTASILDIQKGEEGIPGQIKGTITSGKTLGEVYSNTEFGIYGKINDLSTLNISKDNIMPVALRDEIQEGKAKIVLTIEDGIRREYDIEITKIYRNNNLDNKSMLIKVTDSNLLNLTGGIIQGMSGAPVVQNGKFIGAVTHVFVNNPKEGYAVFGDLMIKEGSG